MAATVIMLPDRYMHFVASVVLLGSIITLLTIVFSNLVRLMLSWVIGYVGTIQLNPAKELAEIPEHSSFFILSPDNRCKGWGWGGAN